MGKITKYLSAAGGYARMKELRFAGFQTREVAELVAQGHIERVKPGLYRLSGHSESGEYAWLAEVCRVLPVGVICLLSALDYPGLTAPAFGERIHEHTKL